MSASETTPAPSMAELAESAERKREEKMATATPAEDRAGDDAPK